MRGRLRSLCLLLAFVQILCILPLSGCKSKGAAPAAVQDSPYFVKTEFLTDEYNFVMAMAASIGEGISTDKLASFSIAKTAHGGVALLSDDTSSYLVTFDEDYLILSTHRISDKITGSPVRIIARDDDSVIVISQTMDASAWSSSCFATVISSTGEILTGSAELAEMKDQALVAIDIDSSGNLFIAAFDRIMKYDANFQLLSTIDLEKQTVLDMAMASDGTLYGVLADGTDSAVLCRIDPDTGKTSQTISLQSIGDAGSTHIYGQSDGVIGSLYLTSNYGVYSYGLTDDKMQEVVAFQEKCITVMGDVDLMMAEDQSFVIRGSYALQEDGSESTGYIRLIPEENVTEKKLLTIGMVGTSSRWMDQVISFFNQNSNQYQMQIKYYGDFSDSSDYEGNEKRAIQAMQLDITTSETPPDIMFLSSDEVQVMTDAGLLEELDGRLSESKVVSEADLMSNVWSASANEGKHYWISPFFSLTGMYTQKSVADTLGEYTVSDLSELSKQMNVPVFGTTSDPLVFLDPYMEEKYVDKESGEVSFTSTSFTDTLAFIKECRQERSTSLITSSFLIQMGYADGFNYYLQQASTYDTEMTMIGFPEISSSKPLIVNLQHFAISAKSLEKDGAWAFMEFLLSDTFQNMQVFSNDQIPIRVSAFENMITEEAAAYKRDIGSQTNGGQQYDEQGNLIQNPTYRIVTIDEKFKNDYRNMVKSATEIYYRGSFICEMILEETNAYFAGDKTADETAKVLQSRVGIYVSEQA